MSFFTQVKEKIREVYATYTIYVDIVLKTALTLLCLFWIRSCFPGGGIFSNVFVEFICKKNVGCFSFDADIIIGYIRMREK